MAQPGNFFDQFDAPQGPLPSPVKQPDPISPLEAARLDMDRERLGIAQDEARRSAERDARDAADDADKAARLAQVERDTVAKLARVIDQIDRVYADTLDNGGLGETGTSGRVMRNVPVFQTAGKDLAAALQTIEANAAFDSLQKMRDASPTGGALGQVTERELDLLKSSVANLDPNQSQDQFAYQIGTAKRVYLDMLARLDPEAAKEIEQRGNPVTLESGAVVYDKRGQELFGGGNASNPPPSDGGGSNLGLGFMQGVGDIVEGTGDIAGMLGGNIVGQGLYNVTGYGDQTYDMGTILREGLGLPDNPNPVTSTINKAATGALSGSLAARGLGTIMQPGVVRNALDIVGRTPIRDTIAGAGSGAGALAGDEIGGPIGATVGALAGGMLGYGGANALARGLGPRSPTPLMQAADRQGVNILPADAGGPIAKAMTTGTKASPLSVGPVVKAAQGQQDQMSSAVRNIASRQGEVQNTDIAGQSIQSAAKKFTAQTASRGARLYDKAAERAKGVKIKPQRTIAALDQEIVRLEQNPASSPVTIEQLKSLRANIVGGVSVQGIRDARTSLSQSLYDGRLRSGQEKAMLKGILSNVAEDIDAGLRSVGRDDAANMFKTADKFWSERVEYIDNVLQPIIGKDGQKSGEQVMAALDSMTRGGPGGAQRLSRLFASMTPEEAGNIRATIVDRLGKANPGSQNAEGNAFSANTFLTNWNKMTPQAKASLFGDKQLRRDLNDIAKLAEGMKASQSMANFSNTAIGIGANAGAGGALFYANPTLAAIGAGIQYATGRLMASPRFARILASTSKLPPEQAGRKLSEQIGVLASREPMLRSDLQAFMNAVNDAGARSPGAVAAQDEQNGRQEPPQ